MKTSIIITSYNKSDFITETVDSLLDNQSDVELVIVDDCSTDNSWDVIQKMTDKRIVAFRNEQNRGANFSRNFGFSKATGELIVFVDGDDVFESGAIDQRARFHEENPDLDVSISAMGTIQNGEKKTDESWQVNTMMNVGQQFLKHQIPFTIMQPTWKKYFLEKTPLFDEKLDRLQDVDFHTQVFLNFKPNCAIRKGVPDCFYRIDEVRNKDNKFEQLTKVVQSTTTYINKYFDSQKKETVLLKYTGYRIYTQLIYFYSQKLVSKNEFRTLEKELLNAVLPLFSKKTKIIFALRRCLNQLKINFRGVNRIVEKCL